MPKKPNPGRWVESSQNYLEHKILSREAEAWFRRAHLLADETTINITRAHEEYCLHTGQHRDCLKMQVRYDKVRQLHIANRIIMSCPVCGEPLKLHILQACAKANPQRYGGILWCIQDYDQEPCPYYAYIRVPIVNGQRDMRRFYNMLEAHRYNELELVEMGVEK
jgi:hypothetical protein